MDKGEKFERKLARLFRHLGYTVERTKASNDHGADLLIRRRRKLIVVQAKSYAKPVGNKAVQEAFAAQAYYDADAAWVVTDSSFTAGARSQADPCGVRLVDGDMLKSLRRKAFVRRWFPVILLVVIAMLGCFFIFWERQ